VTEDTPATAQKYLGRKGLVLFLAALSSFPALSTDLYLPALPGMTAYFGVPAYQTNLTLILFFVVYAVTSLVWGPLSDRYGRRPVLLTGLAIYVVAGVLCGVSANVFQLIAFRVLQAVGAAAASSIATAIVKDSYEGRRREVTIAVVHSMIVLSPAIAPMIGALILRFTSWRGAFMAQAILGVLVLAGAVAFRETIGERLAGHPLASLRRLGVVLANRSFVYLLINFSLLGTAGMAFIASSSYIYEETFGVSGQVYSYFFALFAVGMAVGPQVYVWLSRRFSRNKILMGCFAVSAISGILVLFVGRFGPWPFILALLPSPVAFSCMRPPAVYMMLAQHEGDAGSVSALMGSTFMVMASAGMFIVSIDLWSRVALVGALTVGLAVLGGAMWLLRPRHWSYPKAA
jgi:MFS transporter, DHA1 family, multidrug resistance protein